MIINTGDNKKDTSTVSFSHIFLPLANVSYICAMKSGHFLFLFLVCLFGLFLVVFVLFFFFPQ